MYIRSVISYYHLITPEEGVFVFIKNKEKNIAYLMLEYLKDSRYEMELIQLEKKMGYGQSYVPILCKKKIGISELKNTFLDASKWELNSCCIKTDSIDSLHKEVDALTPSRSNINFNEAKKHVHSDDPRSDSELVIDYMKTQYKKLSETNCASLMNLELNFPKFIEKGSFSLCKNLLINDLNVYIQQREKEPKYINQWFCGLLHFGYSRDDKILAAQTLLSTVENDSLFESRNIKAGALLQGRLGKILKNYGLNLEKLANLNEITEPSQPKHGVMARG